MRVAEVYASLQGEGLLAGTPSTFVRTSGCNLRCIWCDTPFTSWRPEGRDRDVADVLAEVEALGRRHVVVTGGEPLLWPEAADLCRALRAMGHHVTIETAGTLAPAGPGIADLMSISPKLGSAAPPIDTPGDWHARHERARRADDVLRALLTAGPYQVKFVIDTPADLAEALRWLDDLGLARGGIDRRAVLLMPQGRSTVELAARSTWLAGECRRTGLRFAPRHHLAWFGPGRGV